MERPICPTCNKTFSRQPNLNKHLRERESK